MATETARPSRAIVEYPRSKLSSCFGRCWGTTNECSQQMFLAVQLLGATRRLPFHSSAVNGISPGLA
jgi:hypothetical protein